jgi:hypothetical protein
MPLLPRSGAHRLGDLLEDVRRGGVQDGVHRVEAQAVQVKFLEPVEGVVHVEAADGGGRVAVEIDGRAPGRVPLFVEKAVPGVDVQVIALRPEVVVDHVEKHHHPPPVGLLDQGLQLLGGAVVAVRGKEQHAVVAPVAAAREIGHRHQLDGGYAEVDQVVEPFDQVHEPAARGAGTGVQFVEHRLVPGPALPVPVLPGKGERIDHHARAVHVLGLRARGRVRHEQVAVDAKPVGRADLRLG